MYGEVPVRWGPKGQGLGQVQGHDRSAYMVREAGAGVGVEVGGGDSKWAGPGGGHMETPLWTEWQTDMTENITFPQLPRR